MINIRVTGGRGSGKSHFIRLIQQLLQDRSGEYSFHIVYSDGTVAQGGTGSLKLRITEEDTP